MPRQTMRPRGVLPSGKANQSTEHVHPDLAERARDTAPAAANGKKSNMYAKAATWNPFKGCRFDCTYCEPSFKRQSKRQKENEARTRGCNRCYRYVPHPHEDRLKRVPSKPVIFPCAAGALGGEGSEVG